MADRGMFDLRGRIVVVTGAAGQLGREFTAVLLDSGCRVAALDKIGSGDLGDSSDLLFVEPVLSGDTFDLTELARLPGFATEPHILPGDEAVLLSGHVSFLGTP